MLRKTASSLSMPQGILNTARGAERVVLKRVKARIKVTLHSEHAGRCCPHAATSNASIIEISLSARTHRRRSRWGRWSTC